MCLRHTICIFIRKDCEKVCDPSSTRRCPYHRPSYRVIKNAAEKPGFLPEFAQKRLNGYDWGTPIGVKGAVDWTQCTNLTKPDGVENLKCNRADCIGICKPGYRPSKGQGLRKYVTVDVL